MQKRVAIASYEDPQVARDVIADLRECGYADEHVGVIVRDADGEARVKTVDEARESQVGAGAAAGAAAGAGLGGLWALAVAAGVLPAIGPVLAGGLLTAIVASAAAGATAGGATGALLGLGAEKDEAEFFADELKRGRTVVLVTAEDDLTRASAILRQHRGIDQARSLARLDEQGAPI